MASDEAGGASAASAASATPRRLEAAWNAADGVILAHSAGTLRVPAGPLAGEHRATQSLALVRGAAGWRVASFHNTPVVAPPPTGPGPAAGDRAG